MKRGFFVSVLAIVLSLGSFSQAFALDSTKTDDSTTVEVNVPFDVELWQQVWQTTQRRYLKGPVSDSALFIGMLKGIVKAVDDPHSAYFTKDEWEKLRKNWTEEREFGGVGFSFTLKMRKWQFIVVDVFSDSPAEKAGIQSGDRIVAIDDSISADTLGMKEVAGFISGPIGTDVTLTVKRGDEEKKITITRAKIVIEAIEYRVKDKICYIRLRNFTRHADIVFTVLAKGILAAVQKGKINAMVVDVRGNPGGLLSSAVGIGALWLGDKDIAICLGRNSRVDTLNSVEYPDDLEPPLKGLPTVILTNKASASASEILAGALQDHGQAIVVGETSFGKGSVQNIIEMKDGSVIKLTIANWLTPKGRVIDGNGIKPDVEAKNTDEDYEQGRDAAKEKAIEILNNMNESKE